MHPTVRSGSRPRQQDDGTIWIESAPEQHGLRSTILAGWRPGRLVMASVYKQGLVRPSLRSHPRLVWSTAALHIRERIL